MSDKPRICLIYTGGTIGMTKMDDGTIRPPDRPEDFLRVAPELKHLVDFEFVPLLNKDSTNMIPADWTAIAKAVYERRCEGYQGFVIAHGTDTMHFSASAVAFALGKPLPFPVVFTGAQAIPEVHHGDARVNLLRACTVATMDLGEVVISFGDYVFRGCRAQKKDERRFDAFESPAFYPLAFITEEILLTGLGSRRRQIEDGGDIDFRAEFEHGVFQVSLIPGLEPELLLPVLDSPMCKGVILQSFGAGNVPSLAGYSFGAIIEHACKLNIPVIITSQFPANATLHTSYEPGRAAIAAGAIPTGNMTSSCAVAKFRWVLAQVEESFRRGEIVVAQKIAKVDEMMQRNYIDEMDLGGSEGSLSRGMKGQTLPKADPLRGFPTPPPARDDSGPRSQGAGRSGRGAE